MYLYNLCIFPQTLVAWNYPALFFIFSNFFVISYLFRLFNMLVFISVDICVNSSLSVSSAPLTFIYKTCTSLSPTNKTDHHGITEILLKGVRNPAFIIIKSLIRKSNSITIPTW